MSITKETYIDTKIVPLEEQPYLVPKNWTWSRLRNVVSFYSGSAFPKNLQGHDDKEISFYKVGSLKNIDSNFFLYKSKDTIDELTRQNIKAKLVPTSTVLFAKIGEAIKLNRRALVKEEACIDNNLMGLHAKENILGTKYLFYWSLKEDFYQYTQASAIPSIRKSTLEGLPFPLAPINEQKRVVYKLESLLDKIDETQQLIEEAKDSFELRRAAILDKAFRGELTRNWREENSQNTTKENPKMLELSEILNNENRLKEAFNLPKGWVRAKIGDLFHVQVGSTPSRRNEEYWDGTYSWISSGEVQFNTINESREYVTDAAIAECRLKLAPKGSIMFGMIGEGKTRGQVAILNIDSYHNQNVASIWVSETEISSYYVYYWLQSQYSKNRQNSAGNNQPAYNKSRVQELLIPIAPIHEMEVIQSHLQKIFSLETNINELLSLEYAIDNIKQSILTRAFRGELGTDDSTEENAIELLKEVLQEKVK